MLSRAGIAIIFAAVAALTGIFSAGAQAATVNGQTANGVLTVTFNGLPGEANIVDIYITDGKVVVNEEGKSKKLGVVPSGACTRDPIYPNDTWVASCRLPSSLDPVAVVYTGDKTDIVTVRTGIDATVYAGAGNDRVYANSITRPIKIYGGSGNDKITGGGIDADQAHPFGWDDYIEPGDGSDMVAWGYLAGPGSLAGSDRINLADPTASKPDKVQCNTADGEEAIVNSDRRDKLKDCPAFVKAF